MPKLPNISLILGGASSGKSCFAETLATRDGRDRVYVATAQVLDAEMAARVGRHRARRAGGWTTVEEPFALAKVLSERKDDQIVLVDCLTMWLSNHLLAECDPGPETDRLLDALDRIAVPAILVSNEVGASVVPDNPLARRFQAAQGRLNQRVAKRAGLVVQVVAGLPLALKGRLPGDRA